VLISPERSIIDLRRKLNSIALPCRQTGGKGGVMPKAHVKCQAKRHPEQSCSAEGPPMDGGMPKFYRTMDGRLADWRFATRVGTNGTLSTDGLSRVGLGRAPGNGPKRAEGKGGGPGEGSPWQACLDPYHGCHAAATRNRIQNRQGCGKRCK
jgi:hypothetical protein